MFKALFVLSYDQSYNRGGHFFLFLFAVVLGVTRASDPPAFEPFKCFDMNPHWNGQPRGVKQNIESIFVSEVQSHSCEYGSMVV